MLTVNIEAPYNDQLISRNRRNTYATKSNSDVERLRSGVLLIKFAIETETWVSFHRHICGRNRWFKHSGKVHL